MIYVTKDNLGNRISHQAINEVSAIQAHRIHFIKLCDNIEIEVEKDRSEDNVCVSPLCAMIANLCVKDR